MAGTRHPRKEKAAPSAADELRRDAEERLDRLSADAVDAASPVPEDIAAVVHDLRVHQIELEMQNQELRRAQLEPGTAQLLILHLELDLVHAQVVDDSGDVRGHWRGGVGGVGGELVETLLGLPAQLVGRARRGLFLTRLSGAGHQAPLSMSVIVSSTRRRFSGSTFSSSSTRSARVCSAVCMRRPLTSSPLPLPVADRERPYYPRLQRRAQEDLSVILSRRPAGQVSANRCAELSRRRLG